MPAGTMRIIALLFVIFYEKQQEMCYTIKVALPGRSVCFSPVRAHRRRQIMKIYFVRHGETDWNKARRIQGQVDIPLNEFGRHLAEETAKGLAEVPFDICYTSPLDRAVETARIILGDRAVPVIKDARIKEMAFGEYEGKCCSKKGWELPREFQRFFDDPEHYIAPDAGEGFADVKKRTGEFLEELFQRQELKDASVLVTTHGAALAGILNNINGRPLCDYWGVGVHKNCAVTEVEVSDSGARIIAENVVYYNDEVAPWEE